MAKRNLGFRYWRAE